MIKKFNIIHKGLDVRYFARTSSTNALAREDCSEVVTLWIADYQSEGRGQRGNHWHSAEGLNLMFTLSVYPKFLSVKSQFQISEITALAVCQTLQNEGITARIKWPNDIYVGDKKICGILIEHDVVGINLSRSIIGVGININQSEFDENLPNPTSLKLELGCECLDRNRILQNFVDIFFEYYARLADGELFDSQYIIDLYRKDGEYHPFRLACGKEVSAMIEGIDDFGRLQIKDSEQNHYSLAFKEIEYIIG